MSWKDACLGFVRKYGAAARVVATSVLNVVAPGSAALLGLVEKACDTAQDTADAHWDEQLLQATQRNADELTRLGQLFDLLRGDLVRLCDKAFAFADQPDDIEEIVRRALANDRNLAGALHKMDVLTGEFACMKEQNRRLVEGQEEMLPIIRRLDRVAVFFEECFNEGVTPRDLAELLRERQEVVRGIHQRKQATAQTLMRQKMGTSATVCILAAGAAVVNHDYLAVQRELGKAVLLDPNDAELGELHRKATVRATQATPRNPLATPGTTSPTRLQVGDTLDGWKLVARLGSGGWGSVFKAVRGDEVRALKVMHPEFSADERFAERFRGEVMALASLPRHPNLVRIHGFNKATANGCWYLVMEYLDGPTLEQHLQAQGAMTPAQVRQVFGPTAEGLGQAHAAGLFHRDIKPGNLIFRKSDQRLVLVDFGLAIHAADAGQTKIGGMTLQFAAPEQLRGQSANARSDVYSLAATIYFALLHDQPDLRALFDADHAPEELRSLLARALHTNPARRPVNGAEFLTALRVPPVPVPEPKKPEPKPEAGKTVLTNSIDMKFAFIPAGTFRMGSPTSEAGRDDNEVLHTVTLTQPFYLGVYPVTVGEFGRFVTATNYKTEGESGGAYGYVGGKLKQDPSITWRTPGFAQTDRHPVVCVSWNDAHAMVAWLNKVEANSGQVYALPTEAQWEYACRAGSDKAYFWGDDANKLGEYAWFNGNSGNKTYPVETKKPNRWGLWHMHGNVWEWCADWFGDYPATAVQDPLGASGGLGRVFRGGAWSTAAAHCRSASRGINDFYAGPAFRITSIGFRLAVSVRASK